MIGTIEDPKTDEIGRMLKQLRAIRTNTSEKKNLLSLLKAKLIESGYREFVGKANRYGFGPIGASYLYSVPDKKRGYLQPFRGKLVRLVCVGSGRFDRNIMVGEYKG
jgi:hypothetical protein